MHVQEPFNRTGTRSRRPSGPRSRLAGCLLWILVLIAVILALSLIFGSFRKGTRAGSLGPASFPVGNALVA
jgi:hypothetical protein